MIKQKKFVAGFQLSLLLISTFAFAFILSGSEFVSAGEPVPVEGGWYKNSGNNMVFLNRDNANYPDCISCNLGFGPNGVNGVNYNRYTDGTGSTIFGAIQQVVGPITNTLTPASPEAPAITTSPGTDANGNPCTPPAPGCTTTPKTTNGASAGAGNTGDLFSNIADGLLESLAWGAAAFGVGQLSRLAGFNDDQALALSSALGLGVFAYKIAGSAGLKGIAQLGVGLGVAAIIFILMYKDVTVEVVSFQCSAWQAPNGGNNCEVCNDDTLPCSEYRCRSLGQNCELVNPGTDQEKCVNVNPQDVNPPVIRPNEIDLTEGHTYTDVKNSPPGPGFRITNLDSSDGCLKAFTPLEFGVITDEPAQCKIDFNHTTSFDDMTSYMGANNMYLYNHSEIFALPGASAFQGSPFFLENGEDLNFFIRCSDRNGNYNSAEYNVRFCMDPTPDTTAARIKATSIINNGCVAENVNFANVDFYTDEPADCKWSHVDQSYENMQNEMDCSMDLYQINAEKLFTCSANLTGIARDNTDFYVRCKDQPGMEENKRNKNEQSFKFSLHGSGALKMRNTQPNGTIFGAVSPAPVELYTETLFGCDAGKAVCYYSTTGDLDDYIAFFDTNNVDGIHTQRQDVSAGDHEYFIKCVDGGGNVANETINFRVDIDTSAPVVARAYEEDGNLKIVTVRDSQCSYTKDSCDFTFEEGTEMPFANSTVHVAEWKNDETYYIKCRDEFRNEEADCSIVVRPGRNLF